MTPWHKCTDWTGRPLGCWFRRAGKAITTESLWREEFRRFKEKS